MGTGGKGVTPRIRTLKPEYWGDEKLAREDEGPRFLFLGLISMADDAGRVLDSAKQIEAFIYPFHDRSREIRDGLARLTEIGVIVRGATASGQAVIQIVNWKKHQRVDHPNTKAALPEIVGASEFTNIRERVAKDDGAFREGFASRSTTSDLRPVPTTSGSARAREAELVNRLSAEPDRMAVQEFFDALPTESDPETWAAAMIGYLDGIGTAGQKAATPAALCLACREYLQQPTHHQSWKGRHFRAFVESAMRPPNSTRGRPPPRGSDAQVDRNRETLQNIRLEEAS